jgi:hypothetical protein
MTDPLANPPKRRRAAKAWTDDRIEAALANLLRLGVAISALVVNVIQVRSLFVLITPGLMRL